VQELRAEAGPARGHGAVDGGEKNRDGDAAAAFPGPWQMAAAPAGVRRDDQVAGIAQMKK
jgi:hypothetical protein